MEKDISKIIFAEVIGEKITNLFLNTEENKLCFEFSDGREIFLFDAERKCCETRFMHTDDVLSEFVGSTFLGAVLKDGPQVELENPKDADHSIRDVQFLEVQTDAGVFTMANYDIHNGWYSGFEIVGTDKNGVQILHSQNGPQPMKQ